MDAVEPLKVPVALRPVFAEITAITSGFCAEHLDAEYARLCGKLAAKLARKRPSPAFLTVLEGSWGCRRRRACWARRSQ